MSVNSNYSFWCKFLLILETVILTVFGARSEYSRPNGKERDLPDLISVVASWGYPIEPHLVTTEDEYILTIFRIPNVDSSESPVFMQHGLIVNAAVFLLNKQGLAYHLYSKGYDVWIGNIRGSLFSQKHQTLTTNDMEYWNFSFHEMAMMDIPAVLHYIKDVSSKPKVHYVGHSMGSTMFLVMASKRPELLDHVDTATLMAPFATPRDEKLRQLSKSFLFRTAKFMAKNLPKIGIPRHKHMKWYGKWRWRNRNKDSKVEMVEAHQRDYKIKQFGESKECYSVGKNCFKLNPREFDYKNAAEMIPYLIDGTSLKTHIHFLQILKAGRFQEFDYGKRNPLVYPKRTTPPKYKLRNIKKRIYLISGGLDLISTPKDIALLSTCLPNSWLIEEGFEEFEHDTFNYGKGMDRVWDTITCIIKASIYGRDPDVPRTMIAVEDDSPISKESEQTPNPKTRNPFSFIYKYFQSIFYSNVKPNGFNPK